MAGGSLRALLQDTTRELSWDDKYRFALDTARGMKHLHSLKTIHRDLKSDNCLVDEHLRVKVFPTRTCTFITIRLRVAVAAYVSFSGAWVWVWVWACVGLRVGVYEWMFMAIYSGLHRKMSPGKYCSWERPGCTNTCTMTCAYG